LVIVSGSRRTCQFTISVHGGVVNDPSYPMNYFDLTVFSKIEEKFIYLVVLLFYISHYCKNEISPFANSLSSKNIPRTAYALPPCYLWLALTLKMK
jgi:hypothetical protein